MKKIMVFFLIFTFFFSNIFVFSGNIDLDIRLIFQNPSYILEKDIQSEKYTCDSNQTECRVNYNLEINEAGSYKAIGTKYFCQWDFNIWELTWEENKCNPNTIMYPIWIFQTSFKVFLKTDESIFYSREFVIQNGEIKEEEGENNEENSNIIPEQEIFIPDEIAEEAENEIQEEIENEEQVNTNSWEVLTEESNNIWNNEWQEENNIDSHIDFWEQENEILEDINVSQEQKNNWESEKEWLLDNLDNEENPQTLFPFSTKLIFQSPTYLLEKDDENIKNFTCDTSLSECRVNFNLNIDEWSWWKTLGTKYICQWDFWIWELTWEENKCNPNTIIYPIWEFETTYKIQEKSNTWIFTLQTFFIKNAWFIEPVITKTVYIWWGSSSSVSPIFIEIPNIEIQSWLDENNRCKKEDCRVNLNYIQKSSSEVCLWSFPWGTYEGNTHEKCNPWYVDYPLWDFQITLKVYDKNYPENYKESHLFFSNKKIEILKKEEKHILSEEEKTESKEYKIWEQKNEIGIKNSENPNNYTLKITQVLPNPVWVDNLEFIEIQNIWEKTLDLVWCSLDDGIGNGSKPYIISESLLLEPKQTKKFYKYDTKININNSGKEEIHILCYEKIIDSMVWDFSVSEGFILKPEHNISEIASLKKQKNIKSYEVMYHSGEKKIISFEEENTLLQDLMSENISREEKKEKFFDLLEKSFSQKVSKQKWWVKIFGTTFPHTNVIIQLEKKENEIGFFHIFFSKSYANNGIYETKSDKSGNYEVVIGNPDIWEFELKTILNFWENNTYEIPNTSLLEIDKDYIEYIQPKQTQKNETLSISPKAIITLQGNLSQNKTFINNKLICYEVNECSVNLDGSKSEWKKIEYFWDFGNGKIFDRKNPASYKFWVGTHFISLTVSNEMESDTDYFVVEVIGKKEKEIKSSLKVENKIEKNNKMSIIPTAYADNKKEESVKYHILLSLWVFIIFFIGSLILLRRQKII